MTTKGLSLIVLLSAAVLAASCGGYTGIVVVENKASQSIAAVTIAVAGQTIELVDLRPGESQTRNYKVTGEGTLDVKLRFQSGKQLQKRAGYVTSGFNFRHSIQITDDDIAITGGPVKVER